MRKLYMFNMITLDAYFEGLNGEIDWHNVDEEFNDFAIAQLKETGTILFGRVTYELMAGYWPTQEASKSDPVVAGLMNSIPKIVFSGTLKRVDWKNTRLVGGNAVEEISRLKRQPGKDMAVFGSANLATRLIPDNLIDEYRIMVNPVLLGSGKQLFQRINGRLNLQLLRTRTFRSGNVLLCYQPEGGSAN